MRKTLLLGMMGAILIGNLQAGTYMIVVAEQRPLSQTKQAIDTLRQVLIDRIFDTLFENGHIAFDVPPSSLNGWTPEWRLSHVQEARRYGANRIVVIRIDWEEKRRDGWDIKSFHWAILDVRNKIELASGNLEINFLKENETELAASQRIAEELLKGFGVGLTQ